MKLIFFVPKFFAGGAERVAFLLASAMQEKGHEIIIATPSIDGEFSKKFTENFHVVDFGTRKPINSLASLGRLLNSSKPDAIICFGISTGIAAALSNLLFRWRVPVFIRNENNLNLDWGQASPVNRVIGPLLSRWAARRSHIIAVSYSLADATAAYLRIDRSSVTTIINPVFENNFEFYEAESKELHPWLADESVPSFIAIGRLEKQKGFDVLIDAFARVANEFNSRLIIFGSGSLRSELQEKIIRLNLSHCVVLSGYTANSIAQMKAAHAFVLSSRFEGFGLVIVEALWAGTQVISTDCNYGPSEVLEGGKYGYLVPVEKCDALANAMKNSLSYPKSIKSPSVEWFEKFTGAEAAQQHIAMIENLRK